MTFRLGLLHEKPHNRHSTSLLGGRYVEPFDAKSRGNLDGLDTVRGKNGRAMSDLADSPSVSKSITSAISRQTRNPFGLERRREGVAVVGSEGRSRMTHVYINIIIKSLGKVRIRKRKHVSTFGALTPEMSKFLPLLSSPSAGRASSASPIFRCRGRSLV